MSYKLSLYNLVLSIDSAFISHYLWDKVSIGKFSLEKKPKIFYFARYCSIYFCMIFNAKNILVRMLIVKYM